MSTTRKTALKLTSLCLVFLILVTLASRIAANGEDSPTQQALSASGAVVSENKNTPITSEKSSSDADENNNQRSQTDDSSTAKANLAAEAQRAYVQALQTLSILNDLYTPPQKSLIDVEPNHILASLFQNQQGPIASAIRIIYKLKSQTWVPEFISSRLGWFQGRKGEEIRTKAIKVLDLLEHAIELGHTDAVSKLAHISLFSSIPHLHNVTRAFELFDEHAQLTGSSTSQGMMAFFYATGYKSVVEIDQAKALLYYTFSANGGNQGSQMALGFRYWTGIGVNDDCLTALHWYEAAAEHSMAKFLSGPPGGRTMPLTSTKLSDLAGGVYGLGASVASTGVNALRPVIRAAAAHQSGETWEDVLEYYMFNADRGDIQFAYRLGKIFYQGSIYAVLGGIASGGEGVGAVQRDYGRARMYFMKIARSVWPQDSPASPFAGKKDGDEMVIGYAAQSASYLGRMYLRGEGVKPDPVLAKMWFERGAEYREAESHNGLGIIWRDGLVKNNKDMEKALSHFFIAAGQELAEALVNVGKYHYEKQDYPRAITFFDSAMRHGSPFEAYYYLAEIHASQAQSRNAPENLVASSCAMATSFYKLVAERGSWNEDLMRDGETRWRSGTAQGKEEAMLRWWIASERGYEVAQNNLAWILDQDRSLLRVGSVTAQENVSNDTARLALTQWTRSASQRSVDALVKVGDYYFHGLGVSDEPEAKRWEKAAAYYQSAANSQLSAMAIWNLGWMYENGVGVPQDFYLAKRYYDMALETNNEAYFPVALSLIKLHIRSLWHTLKGGKDGLSFWNDDTANKDQQLPELEGSTTDEDVDEYYDADDDTWYRGRAKDEHNRRRGMSGAGRQVLGRHEEDPIEWARNHRDAENERDADFGPEDFFDGAIRTSTRQNRDDRSGPGGHHGGHSGDDFLETMLLVVLCVSVSLLIWFRSRWVERRRREEEQMRDLLQRQQQQRQRREQEARDMEQLGQYQRPQQPQQPQAQPPQPGNFGLFPQPGDPARDEWAVMR